MAHSSPELIAALRATAIRLRSQESTYQWGHMGSCNCGHLVQTVTRRTPAEIHAAALARSGDWTDQSREYCPSSGLEFDMILSELFELGLSSTDVRDLEYLANPAVTRRIDLPLDAGSIAGSRPSPSRPVLSRNRPHHVALYLEAWADCLEEQPAHAQRAAARADREAALARPLVRERQPVGSSI